MLGHSSITLTLDTYSHLSPALHAVAASHMETLFSEVRQGPLKSRATRTSNVSATNLVATQ
jgi:hypothetical protein